MRAADVAALAGESLRRHRLRTGLSLLAVAIGATAVLLLTALGDAARRYVVEQFAAFGTNVVAVLPGRIETSGFGAAVAGGTRELTLEDAEDIRRRAGAVREVTPFSLGTARAEYEQRNRDVFVIGTTSDYARILHLSLAAGRFLPAGDARRGEPVVVLGSKLRLAIFGSTNPMGRVVRLGGQRFRVIGVLEPKGQSLGVDFDDLAIVPVATAMRLFNHSGLNRILVQAPDEGSLSTTARQARAILTERHKGEDFTLITQDAMLQSFRSIIDALTLALAAIAAISLAVAGIGIMNVMLVSVSERVSEVGLLKALGGQGRQILSLFLAEALLLAGAGAVCGVVLGAFILRAASEFWPELSLVPNPYWAAGIVGFALFAGALFGAIPALRAARLPAADSLRGRR
jgi:putative ABC transport system permease protein